MPENESEGEILVWNKSHVVFDDTIYTVTISTSTDTKVWIRLFPSRNSRIQVILQQEENTELYDEWLTANERLTNFRKYRERIVGRVKGAEYPSVQGYQSSEEDIFVRERLPRSSYRPSVREPGTNGNHAPIYQSQNYGSSYNSPEIPVLMENVRPKGTEYQYVTFPSGGTLRRNVHVRCSKLIRKYPQRYNPGFGAAI